MDSAIAFVCTFGVLIASAHGGLPTPCTDADGVLNYCSLNTDDQTECCKCSSGCCSEAVNDLCGIGQSAIQYWVWIVAGVGGFIALIIIIGVVSCCVRQNRSRMTTVVSQNAGMVGGGGVSVISQQQQQTTNSNPYGYSRMS